MLLLLRDVFRARPKAMALLILLLIVTSLTAGISLGLLIPLLESFQGSGSALASPVSITVKDSLASLGIPFGLGSVLALLLAVSLLRQILSGWSSVLGYQIAGDFAANLRTDFCEDLLEGDIAFFDRTKAGELGNLIAAETEQARVACGLLFNCLTALGLITIGTAVALLIAWKPALFATAVFSIFFLASRPFVAKTSKGGKELERAHSAFHTTVLETIRGVRTIRAFGTERFAFEQYRRDAYRVRGMLVSISKGLAYNAFAQEFGQAAFLCAMVFFAVNYLQVPWMMLLGLLFVIHRVGPQVAAFNKGHQALVSYLGGYHRLLEKRAELAGLRARLSSGKRQIPSLERVLELQGVGFSYDAAGAKILDGVSLNIRAGEFIGVVGPSGAGKSTFVNLLLRFYDPQEGTIRADGADCREFELGSWRKLIGFVGQDTFLFDTTIRENIAVGRQDATIAEIREAARLANAEEFILALPDGYDSHVGEGGLRLSGGQRQRLALARALIRRSSIILLDEATSHLDTESELQIRKALKNLPDNRTIIAVAHRLSSLADADRIIVLEAGRVVEDGSRADLLAKDSRFARMLRQQEREVSAPPAS